MTLYREEILDHYKNPRNFGKMDKPDVTIQEANTSCGDLIELNLKFSSQNRQQESKRIKKIKFQGQGCAIVLAATSLLTEFVKGKEVATVKTMKEEDIYKLLGGPVSLGRKNCATLSLKALKEGLKDL